jgi:formamidopyrimidine-DNA glycosylase
VPEIAEVRRVVDQLSAEYGGQSLLDVQVIGGRFLKEPIANLSCQSFPLTNAQFNAKGKFIYWTFGDPTNEYKEHFFITLGMSASFGKLQKHSAVKFVFSNGEIYFNDIRRFGTIKVGMTNWWLNNKLKSLGWDALQDPQIPNGFLADVKKHGKKTIAEVLMNQSMFAGCGNYLKSEILYAAKIHPNRLVASFSDDDLLKIGEHYIRIAHEAYRCGGATIATYSDLYGNVGEFYKEFKVYGRKFDPDGNPVVKIKTKDGRTSHIVERVQQL